MTATRLSGRLIDNFISFNCYVCRVWDEKHVRLSVGNDVVTDAKIICDVPGVHMPAIEHHTARNVGCRVTRDNEVTAPSRGLHKGIGSGVGRCRKRKVGNGDVPGGRSAVDERDAISTPAECASGHSQVIVSPEADAGRRERGGREIEGQYVPGAATGVGDNGAGERARKVNGISPRRRAAGIVIGYRPSISKTGTIAAARARLRHIVRSSRNINRGKTNKKHG